MLKEIDMAGALARLKDGSDQICAIIPVTKETTLNELLNVWGFVVDEGRASENRVAKPAPAPRPADEVAMKWHGSGNEVATYKEYKEIKKVRNKEERAAPTLDEVKQFVKEEGLTIDPARFFNFYESQDWKTSSGYPIRDWKSKARSWQSSERPKRKEELPDFYNPEPIRDPEPKLATPEEIARVRALLNKGRKTK